MPPVKLFYVFVTALLASLLIMPSLYNVSIQVGGMDMPDESRKIHTRPIPRIGGIAILCGLLMAILLFNPESPFIYGLVTGILIIFVVGLIDDLRRLSSLQKLAGQVMGTSVGVIISQNHLSDLGNLFATGNIHLPPAVAIPFTIFCIVGLINSLNMIDGLDGLAGGVSAIIALALGVLAFKTGVLQVFFIAIALLGAVMGFLAHNTYPARIFMGDSGSNLLGFTLGMLAVKLAAAAPTISPIAIIAIMAVPVGDTLFVMVKRLINGQPVMGADRSHMHHRLIDLGLSHSNAVLTVFGCTYVTAAVGVFFYDCCSSSLLLFILVSTGLTLTLQFILSRRRKPSEIPPVSLLQQLFSLDPALGGKLLLAARYLIIFILAASILAYAAPQGHNADPVVPMTLLLLLLFSLLRSFPWSNHLLLLSLYLTSAYILFEFEDHGRGLDISSLPLTTLSAALFTLLAVIIGIYLYIRRRNNILTGSAVEFAILLTVIFLPLLPEELTARYHLLTVAGKSIILFVAYKLILISSEATKNRVVIAASIVALTVSLASAFW